MDKIVAVYADKVKKEKVKFLWYPYMLDNNVNIVGGEAGTGKTWFLCALMAAVTTGQPDGMPGRLDKKGKVIYAGGEDGNAVMRERLEHVGADLEKVMLIEKRFDALGEDFKQLVREEKPALIIFDPLLSYVSDKSDPNKYTAAKALMDNIREFARVAKTSVVCVIHPPKKDEYRLIHRFTGSGGFVDAARAVTYVGYHPDVSNKRVVIQPKNNAGYTIPAIFEIDDELGFIWCGDDETITARDVESSHRDSGKKVSNMDSYVLVIENVLRANPGGLKMTAKDILKAYGGSEINPSAFGQMLNKDALKERLLRDGVVLEKGARTGNRQQYIIKYE